MEAAKGNLKNDIASGQLHPAEDHGGDPGDLGLTLVRYFLKHSLKVPRQRGDCIRVAIIIVSGAETSFLVDKGERWPKMNLPRFTRQV